MGRIAKPENFQIGRGAEGRKEEEIRVNPRPTIEFFDPVDKLPQFRDMIDVEMVDVNLERPVASVGEGHAEEWRSDITKVNRSP